MKNPNYIVRTTKMTVLPDDSELYDELAITIEIVDDGAGEFIEMTQDGETTRFGAEEWPIIREAIERMVAEIEAHQKPVDSAPEPE